MPFSVQWGISCPFCLELEPGCHSANNLVLGHQHPHTVVLKHPSSLINPTSHGIVGPFPHPALHLVEADGLFFNIPLAWSSTSPPSSRHLKDHDPPLFGSRSSVHEDGWTKVSHRGQSRNDHQRPSFDQAAH
ncbi:hypothetical protein AMTR_s00024p00253860 [Amborella trichopoda]|uniref:Uncharacterized protein n=1 Tax=Amborella trichopoda TaxID=13333 RepID=W1PVP3_AMBTC|nr:hypothetical protein AMTR_s00024p00253860 [Amborella trichopoda]